jgi:hypothetical protein
MIAANATELTRALRPESAARRQVKMRNPGRNTARFELDPVSSLSADGRQPFILAGDPRTPA